MTGPRYITHSLSMLTSKSRIITTICASLACSSAHSRISLAELGDAEADLVYTPVDPCRIADTRNGSVAEMAHNSTRTFRTFGTLAQLSPQGGLGCALPASASGTPVAAMLQFSAITPDDPGRIMAGPSGGLTRNVVNFTQSRTFPLSSNGQSITFGTIANGIIVKLNAGEFDAIHMSNGLCSTTVQACVVNSDCPSGETCGTSNVDLAIDVHGYFFPVAERDLPVAAHSGSDVLVGSISSTGYVFVDSGLGGAYDSTPGSTVDSELNDILVSVSAQVWSSDQASQLEGEISPCYREPSGEIVVCRDVEGSEAETDFCFQSSGVDDQSSVSASCVFRSVPSNQLEFGLCARLGSSYSCLSGPPPTFNIGGVKVGVIRVQ